MIEYIIKCDRCRIVLEEAWMTCEWKMHHQTHLCKKCTGDFNKWLKDGVKE